MPPTRMDAQRRKFLYNRCDPAEFLEPDDDRYVDVDHRGDPDHRVRGGNWVTKLATRIELSNQPVRELLTGLPGSGKSTELRRLARYLSDRGPNMFVVVVDAEQSFDLASQIDVPDIVLAILDGVDARLLAAEGKDPRTTMEESYFTRFWNWVTRTEVNPANGTLTLNDRANLVLELKTRPSLRAQVRSAVAAHLSKFLEEARAELTLMLKRAEDVGYKGGIVVIVDSLEKLRGISTTWEAVNASAEQVFAGGAPYLDLPIHVLYTIPTVLTSRPKFGQVEFMPMLKLLHRDGSEFEAGLEAAYDLVTRRVPEADLGIIFGDKYGAAVERLTRWSGGYPREIVRLLQSAIAAEAHPLSESAVSRLLNEVGDQYRKMIPASAFPWLAQVAVTQYMTRDNDEQRQIAEAMLSSNAILRYLNDQEWFDLHPAVRTIPGVDAAIKKLQQGEPQSGA